MAMSFEDRQLKLRAALEKKYPRTEGQWESGAYLCATFDDVAIIQRDGKLWRLPYRISEEQDVLLEDAVLVAVQYEPVSEAVAIGKPLDRTGASWEVRILKFGLSKNGWLWTRESAEALLPHLPGAPIGCYVYKRALEGHAETEAIVAAGGPLIRNIVGDLQKPRIEPDGIYAEAHIHEDSEWVRKKLLGLEQRGLVGQLLGLSVDTISGFVPVQVREATRTVAAKWIREIKRVLSVDIVTAPSADGRFIRATEGPLLTHEEEDCMTRTQLLALIKEHRPKLLEGRTVESLTDQDLEGLVREALKPPAAAPEPKPDDKPEWARKLEHDLAVRDTQARVSEALTASKLPTVAQAALAKRFTGRVAEAAEIEAAITEQRDLIARISESGEVRGFGGGRAVVLVDSVDKIQVAMDRLFGVSPATLEHVHEAYTADAAVRVKEALEPAIAAHKDAGAGPRFRGLREAYVAITGDHEVRGLWDSAATRVSESINSGTWANVLGNTLYRRFLQDYAQQDYGERRIISVGRAEDFRTKDAVRIKYFGDIEDVDPENADYNEIDAVGDEKVTYAVIQKGNTLTITRKTIINDDMRAVSTMVGRLGRSFRRTFARYVWNFFINNVAYDVDGVAWFHASHNNLQSAALAAAEIEAAIIKLQNMTEPGSGEKLGLFRGPGFDSLGLWLVVPTALWGTARKENEREYLDANFTPNAVRYAFGRNSERIIVNPLLTDVTDWGVFRDPADVESIVIDFLMGREEPEFFLADQPTVGQMFVGYKLQYKGRHEYGGDVADYRGAVKAVVAG